MSPLANPIAVVEIRVAGVAIADKSLVMATTGTQRPCPATVAVVLAVDPALLQELAPLFHINTCIDMADDVVIRIDKTVARSDVAGGANPYHP